MRNLKLTLFFLLSFLLLPIKSSFALPTTESLFQNAKNPDVVGDLVSIGLLVLEKTDPLLEYRLESEKRGENDNNDPIKEGEKAFRSSEGWQGPIYLKLIFSLSNPNRSSGLLQIIYSKKKMSMADIVAVDYIPRLNSALEQKGSLHSQVLYSLIMLFAANDASGVYSLLTTSYNFRPNLALENSDKRNLLERYRSYLESIKGDQELEKSIRSPLSPEDREERAKVKKILSSPFFRPDENVSLVKNGSVHFFKVDLERLQASFHLDSHFLAHLSTDDGLIEWQVGDFILFDGTHFLPEKMSLKGPLGREWEISPLKLQVLEKYSKDLAKRASEYEKYFERNQKGASGEVLRQRREKLLSLKAKFPLL